MKLSVSGFALACAVLWALAVLAVTLGNQWFPPYGEAFLAVLASLYPGYQLGGGMSAVVIGTLYALVDAAIAGALLAWLYNLLAR